MGDDTVMHCHQLEAARKSARATFEAWRCKHTVSSTWDDLPPDARELYEAIAVNAVSQ
jgi:hypothetical protein